MLGLVLAAGGGALLYYVSNAVAIEIEGASAIERLAAGAIVTSSTGPGTPLLLAGGIAIADRALPA